MRHLLYILSMTAMPAMAQMDNTVEVTREVKPVVKDANKINILPNAVETPVKHYNVQYSAESKPTQNFVSEPMTDPSSEAVLKGNKSGYLQLAGGTSGKVDSHAAYQFDLTDNDAIAIDLSLKGFNGTAKSQPTIINALQPSTLNHKWKSRDYHNRMGATYNHRFDNGVDLYVKGGFENRMFNYQPFTITPAAASTDKQHNVMANFNAGITPYSFGDFTLGLTAGVNFFSQEYATNMNDKYGETTIKLNADGAYKFSEEHSVGIGAEFYNNSYSMDKTDGITHMHFTPHYTFKNSKMTVQLGVFAGTDGDIAPDVHFTYHITPRSDFYIKAAGYEEENDMRHLTALHPYFIIPAPAATSQPLTLESEFHQLDACIGYRFNSQVGISGDINAGYDMAENTAEADWMYGSKASPMHPLMAFSKTRRFYINADLAYAYRDIVKISTKNTFNAHSAKEEEKWVSGSYLRPTVELLWKADVKIINDLYFGADWQLGYYDCPESEPAQGKTYERPTSVNLGASLRYTLPVKLPLTVFVKGDNLLNAGYDRHFGYRNIGANVMGGFALSF